MEKVKSLGVNMELEKLQERVKKLAEFSGLKFDYKYSIDKKNDVVLMSFIVENAIYITTRTLTMRKDVFDEIVRFSSRFLVNCAFAPHNSILHIGDQPFLDMDDEAFELWMRFN